MRIKYLREIPTWSPPAGGGAALEALVGGGGSVGLLPLRLVQKNQNGVSIPIGKKLKICFDRIHERDGRTDGRTDEHCATA